MPVIDPPTNKTNDLYRSGEYVQHFRTAFESDAFQAIYVEKRDYVIGRFSGTGLRVLDVGGGLGRLTVPLAQRHRMTLVDLSVKMLQVAGESGGEFARINCNAESLCFEDHSFDAVLAIDLVPHLPRLPETLLELRRVLKPGGTLLIDTTNSNPLWVLAYPRYAHPWHQPARFIRTVIGRGVLPEWQGRIHHLSRRSFGAALSQAGFEVFEWVPFGPTWCPKWFLAVCRAR